MRLPVPKRLVDWLIDRAHRTPYYHLEGYMRRWWVFRLGPRHQSSRYGQSSTGWLSARIHEILRSDDDRALHDHPQDYCSIILRGGYYELTPAYGVGEGFERRIIGTYSRWYGPGDVLFRRAESLHRLVVPDGETTVTLFITGPRRREWGFQTSSGWMPWKEYEALIASGEIQHVWREPYARNSLVKKPGINDELDALLHQAIDSVHDRATALSASDPAAFVEPKERS